MSNGTEESNAAGWNVELSAETADRAEELLRDLATDAELEMAVVVERSGGMIAGVATRQDVDVSTVGALVAGAFGAMGALANELGESKVRESLHQGSGDTVYLREVGERFVLLGVAPSSLPSGLIREKGAQVADKLTALFYGTADAAAETTDDESESESEAAGEPAGELPPVEEAPVQAAEVPVEPEPKPEPEPPVANATTAEPSPFQASETGPVPVPESGEVPPVTGVVHTEISVEDEHAMSLTPPPESAAEGAATEPEAVSDEPPEEKPGQNPTYIFEIG